MNCLGDFSNNTIDMAAYGAFGDSTLRRGSRGSDVIELQKALNGLGFNAGVEDGIFGGGTERALINFQSANALTPDGIAGPMTIGALKKKGITTPKVSSPVSRSVTSQIVSPTGAAKKFAPVGGGYMAFLAKNKTYVIGGGLSFVTLIGLLIIMQQKKKKGSRKTAYA